MIEFQTVIEASLMTKANYAKVMKMLNWKVMVRHALTRLPKHFEVVPETYPGAGGYRYRKRGRDYTDKKERKYGHRKPNVLTGALRQAVLSRVHITATQYHGTLRTRGTLEHQLSDWQRKEIEVRTKKEFREDVEWQRKRYLRMAKSDKYKRKRRRKVG